MTAKAQEKPIVPETPEPVPAPAPAPVPEPEPADEDVPDSLVLRGPNG